MRPAVSSGHAGSSSARSTRHTSKGTPSVARAPRRCCRAGRRLRAGRWSAGFIAAPLDALNWSIADALRQPRTSEAALPGRLAVCETGAMSGSIPTAWPRRPADRRADRRDRLGRQRSAHRRRARHQHQLAVHAVTALGGLVRRTVMLRDDVRGDRRRAARGCLARRPALLFTVGGLGPTSDDRTLEGVALGLGVELELHPEAERMVAAKYESSTRPATCRSRSSTRARRKMARLPAGARAARQPHRRRAGRALPQRDDTRIVSLPGVPGELKAIVDESLGAAGRRGLRQRPTTRSARSRCELQDESAIADILRAPRSDHPAVYVKSRAKVLGSDARDPHHAQRARRERRRRRRAARPGGGAAAGADRRRRLRRPSRNESHASERALLVATLDFLSRFWGLLGVAIVVALEAFVFGPRRQPEAMLAAGIVGAALLVGWLVGGLGLSAALRLNPAAAPAPARRRLRARRAPGPHGGAEPSKTCVSLMTVLGTAMTPKRCARSGNSPAITMSAVIRSLTLASWWAISTAVGQ